MCLAQVQTSTGRMSHVQLHNQLAYRYWRLDFYNSKLLPGVWSRNKVWQRGGIALDRRPPTTLVFGSGLHAYKSLNRAIIESRSSYTSLVKVIGAVLLAGSACQHSNGWRAQQATILAVYFTWPYDSFDVYWRSDKKFHIKQFKKHYPLVEVLPSLVAFKEWNAFYEQA